MSSQKVKRPGSHSRQRPRLHARHGCIDVGPKNAGCQMDWHTVGRRSQLECTAGVMSSLSTKRTAGCKLGMKGSEGEGRLGRAAAAAVTPSDRCAEHLWHRFPFAGGRLWKQSRESLEPCASGISGGRPWVEVMATGQAWPPPPPPLSPGSKMVARGRRSRPCWSRAPPWLCLGWSKGLFFCPGGSSLSHSLAFVYVVIPPSQFKKLSRQQSALAQNHNKATGKRSQ